MSDYILVLTTTESREQAQQIAHALVERRLAACVNIVGPVESVYRWKGEVESAVEHLLVIKTAAGRFAAVRDAIRELHTYELPECIQIPIDAGSEGYLAWIADSVR